MRRSRPSASTLKPPRSLLRNDESHPRRQISISRRSAGRPQSIPAIHKFACIIAAMPVVICMLRGVNVGAHNRVKMDDLKKLCTSLKLCNPQTYVQSGNIVFTTDERDLDKLRTKLETAIHKKFSFQSDVILRNT